MEITMIDGNALLSLELCALAVLIGVGVWRIYRTRQSATINASASVAHDMRHDGQRLSIQADSR
jgi:ABC-type nickel/cobalt efflux system permease component RcnA